MATLTITLAGSGIVNGSKTFNLSDSDLQSLLDWAGNNYSGVLVQSPPPTNQQILLAWVNGWINATINSVRQFKTLPAVVPAPISIA